MSYDHALRTIGLPGLSIWEGILPKLALRCHEDNQPMIRVLETGRNPTMCYLHRTHRVSVAWLHEAHKRKDFILNYEQSERMCADIYTKSFTDAGKWEAACELINIVDPKKLWNLLSTPQAQFIEPPTATTARKVQSSWPPQGDLAARERRV